MMRYVVTIAAAATAAGGAHASPAGPLLRLLKSGRLPAERQGPVVKLICRRGDAEDLAYLLRRAAADGDGAFAGGVRLAVLEGLADAAEKRKVKPAGGLGAVARLIADGDARTRAAAVRLAGLWGTAAPALADLALSPKTPESLRADAVAALGRVGSPESAAALAKLAGPAAPQPLRFRAVAALAAADLPKAAGLAANVLKGDLKGRVPGAMLKAFVERKGGPDALAAALAARKPNADSAKLALRYLYSVGQSGSALTDALSKAAGINLNRAVTPAQINELVGRVREAGDPARGETVFRRADLSCAKCHMLNGAGGQVGPDLRDIGSSSPPDYILRSILLPSESIKEEYLTAKVFTADSRVFEGIVVDDTEDALTLKDAEGNKVVISQEDVAHRQKGQSLMPKGLADLMTRQELVDLSAFLSRLGKPGAYRVRPEPVVRTWRVLTGPSDELTEEVPTGPTLRSEALAAPPERWATVYATVAGDVPLAEAAAAAKSPVVYLKGRVSVGEAGPVKLTLDSADGVAVFVDGSQVPAGEPVELTAGPHAVVLRVDTAARKPAAVRLTLAGAVPVNGV